MNQNQTTFLVNLQTFVLFGLLMQTLPFRFSLMGGSILCMIYSTQFSLLQALSNFTVLTQGDMIEMAHNSILFGLLVMEKNTRWQRHLDPWY